MKLTTTNQWVVDFIAMTRYLSLVRKEDNRVLIVLPREVAYAISRTKKKIQSDFDAITEEEEKHKKEVIELQKDTSPEGKAALEKSEEDWKTFWIKLMKTKVEVEVHSVSIEDLPKQNELPAMFFDVLSELVIEPAAKKVE